MYERKYYEMIDRFIAPSEYAAYIVSEQYRTTPVDVVPHPVSHACEPSEKRNAKTMIWIGRRDEGKGYRLLPALADALADGWTLAAIGVDAQTAREDGVEHEKIAWLGKRDSADICSALQSARALLYPTLYPETFGLAVAEAIMTHCPVLTTDRGAVAELMHGTEHNSESPYGILLPPPVTNNAIDAWRDAVADVCEYSFTFNVRCADEDRKKFSSDVFLKNIESTYNATLREYV